jgi:hypothetical protein
VCWQKSAKAWIEELAELVLDANDLVLVSRPAFLRAPPSAGKADDAAGSAVLVPRRINFDPRVPVAEVASPGPAPSLDQVRQTPASTTHTQVQPVSVTDWTELLRGLVRAPLSTTIGADDGDAIPALALQIPVRSRLRSLLGLVYGGLHYGPGVVLTEEGTDGVVPAVWLASGETRLLPAYVVEILAIVEKASGLVECALYIFRDPLITGTPPAQDSSSSKEPFPFATCWDNAQIKRTSNSSDGTIRYGVGNVECGWVRRLDPLTWHNDVTLFEDPANTLSPARTFSGELSTLASLAEQVQAAASQPIELLHSSSRALEKNVQEVTTQAKSAISINNALRDKLIESDETTKKWRDSINSAFSAGRVVPLTIEQIQEKFSCETRDVFSVACPGAGADIFFFGAILWTVVTAYAALLYLCMGKKLG